MLSGKAHQARSSESGAAAIISALVALIVFAFAALAVDLGNVLARKGDTQAQVDFGALAGATAIDGNNARTTTDPAVQAVAEYMFKNLALDEEPGYVAPASADVLAANLVDSDLTNGDVQFTSDGRMRVLGPRTQINFGFAGVFEIFRGGSAGNRINVVSEATVLTGTPKGRSVFPMYVANPTPGNPACDYGLQTLTDPPGGQVVPPAVPTLNADADTNDNDLDTLTLTVDGNPATTVPIGSTTARITLTGRFKDATRVGFFRADDPTLAPAAVERVTWVNPTGATPYTSNNGSVTVTVPSSVAADGVLWYVRVFQGLTVNKWSARAEALPLSVGDAPYECVGGSASGNFGTIKLPRSDSSNTQNDSGWIPRNIALGLQSPLSMDIFPGNPPPSLCTSFTPQRVYSTASSLLPFTNCVDTDTGLTANTATPGFISGKASAYSGLLNSGSSSADPDGSGGCSRAGNTDTTSLSGTSVKVNDDLLTCFMTDTTTEIGDVARRNYAGDAKFDPAIYRSPRFGWVPVFAQEATSGGSQKYSIVDYRGAFITDQPMTATKATNAFGTSTVNGLGVTGSGGGFKLQTLKVVFLHPNSLPDGDGDTPIGPNLGVGPIVSRLVD